ncbi:ATP-dependent nuclease [Candidatus Corynebacterium faecigallinarum]|uniref:ATP-dependent nuclease n=1 Tax=Candidatus Corynebacterium faecigallinarum TaxID=2838528 RepID=UPI003FD320C0
MKLESVSVRKYRSIDTKAQFDIGDYTVLVGPNNQGKSNLLRATVLGMVVIRAWRYAPDVASSDGEMSIRQFHQWASRFKPLRNEDSENDRVSYDWERDFPLFARGRKGASTSTVIQFNFHLSSAEQDEFKDETGISINESLPVRITLRERSVSLAIPKQGRGEHKKKARKIARFVDSRINLLYIPAVRTSVTAVEIAQQILASRRRILNRSSEYTDLLEKIDKFHDDAERSVENILKRTLDRFVPDTTSVGIETNPLSSSWKVRDIRINDGSLTSLSAKGDGIQSLVALALTLEWTRSKNRPDRNLIIAVEEPESHLHPGAIHELRSVLHGIAEQHQVVITTHSQSLINRSSLSSNVIVEDRSARPSKSLKELRSTLGVEVSDSLSSSEVMVICEGDNDIAVLPTVLAQIDRRISEWVKSGRLEFSAAHSGSKISTHVTAANSILAKPVVVIDGDKAGKGDVLKLISSGLLDRQSIVSITRPHAKHSELEDIFRSSVYLDSLERMLEYKFSDKQKRILDRGTSDAWSERLETILEDSGFPDPGPLVDRAKFETASAVKEAAIKGNSVVKDSSLALVNRLLTIIAAKLGA